VPVLAPVCLDKLDTVTNFSPFKVIVSGIDAVVFMNGLLFMMTLGVGFCFDCVVGAAGVSSICGAGVADGILFVSREQQASRCPVYVMLFSTNKFF
jgi:hypothetical protein